MPRMTSMSEEPRAIRDARNKWPPMRISFPWLILDVVMLALGDMTMRFLGSGSRGRPCISENLTDTKDCDAPVSNNTLASIEFTGSIPRTTSGAS